MDVLNGTVFHNTAGLENDNCYLSQRSMQSVKKNEYMLTNYYGENGTCNNDSSIDFATRQPGINFKSYVMPSRYGCSDDAYQTLRIDTLNVTPRTKLMLNKRPYLTVPYLGKGVFNPDLHSKMRMGDPINRNTPDVTSLTKHNMEDYPFIPIVRDTVSNPDNYIVESEGWVRGGIPSRDFFRDHSYKNLNNINHTS